MLNHPDILSQQEKRLHRVRTRRHILQAPGVKEAIILLCIVVDAFNIFAVLDLYQTQQAWLTWIITGTAAFCLDVPPMLIGSCIQNRDLPDKHRMVLCICLLLVFLIVFGAVFALRMATVEDMFQSTSDIGLQVQTGTAADAQAAEVSDGPTAAQYIIAVLTGLLPLGTSICSFYLGAETSPEQNYRHQLEMNRIQLREEIDRLKVMRRELASDMTFDLDAYDEARCQIRRDLTHKEALDNKHTVRRILAEHLGTPDAITDLMEQDEAPAGNVSSVPTSPNLSVLA